VGGAAGGDAGDGLASADAGGGDGDSGDGAGGAGDDLGERVYARSCALCHGGSGEGATGPSLVGVEDRLTIEQHRSVVQDGRARMPGWSGSLSAEEIEAVVEYERTVLSRGGG
jgi:mono/diheme cytochrome c family protein